MIRNSHGECESYLRPPPPRKPPPPPKLPPPQPPPRPRLPQPRALKDRDCQPPPPPPENPLNAVDPSATSIVTILTADVFRDKVITAGLDFVSLTRIANFDYRRLEDFFPDKRNLRGMDYFKHAFGDTIPDQDQCIRQIMAKDRSI